MYIATWNIERLKHASRLEQIQEVIYEQEAPILVLTEADTRLELPGYDHIVATDPLPQPEYKATERRVIIYTVFPVLGHLETYDPQTACCALIETPRGIIAFYGTIVGIHGNRRPSFTEDLKQQVKDWKRISATYPLCIIGDLNMSFSDNYYFTKEGRRAMKTAFTKCNLFNVTEGLKENIDHIVVSRSIESMDDDFPMCDSWNDDKTLSDHIGVRMGWYKFTLDDDDEEEDWED